MARAGIGPIIPDRVASKPASVAAKPAAASAKTKAQIEADERAKAAAAKAAAIESERKRDQARADAYAAEQKRIADEKAAAIASEARRDAAMAARAPAPIAESRSDQSRRPDNWNEIIHDDRNDRGVSWDRNPAPPKTETPKQETPKQEVVSNPVQGGSSSTPREEKPPVAVPPKPVPLVVQPREPVKHAAPGDVLIDVDDLPVDLIAKLTLEKIGGLELISLVRHDTVNGQNIVYRPVRNVSQIAIDYNPQNMIKMPDSADSYFKNFAIKLETHIQQTTNELPPLVAYIDSATGNVIIDLVNLKADYEIEVQMVSSGKVFNDTMYIEESS
jgi:hypothetical protein